MRVLLKQGRTYLIAQQFIRRFSEANNLREAHITLSNAANEHSSAIHAHGKLLVDASKVIAESTNHSLSQHTKTTIEAAKISAQPLEVQANALLKQADAMMAQAKAAHEATLLRILTFFVTTLIGFFGLFKVKKENDSLKMEIGQLKEKITLIKNDKSNLTLLVNTYKEQSKMIKQHFFCKFY